MHELDIQLGKGWEQKALNIYSEGGFDAEVAKELGITLAMFSNLYRAYPLFEEVVNKGRSDCRAWFEKLGRQGLIKANGDLNHAHWLVMMKNNFGYAAEDTTPPGLTPSTLSNDEIEQRLAEKIKKALPAVASKAP